MSRSHDDGPPLPWRLDQGSPRVQLHVERQGEGDPCVLIHGFGASGFTWRRITAPLARGHQLMLVDLKGFGASPKPLDGGYEPTHLAADVYRFIRERDLRGVTLVGHSLGGGIALMVALALMDEGEDRLRRLISLAGVAYPQGIPRHIGLVRTHAAARLLLKVVPARWLMRKILSSIVSDPTTLTDDQIEGYARPLRTPGAREALVQTAMQIVPEGLDALVARYPQIRVPTLLIWGREDPVVPVAVGHRLQRDLPDARLVILDGCGHLPHEEKAEECLAYVQEFLRST